VFADMTRFGDSKEIACLGGNVHILPENPKLLDSFG
jgi:hypothetical protein